MRHLLPGLLALALPACTESVNAGGTGEGMGDDDDPLAIADTPEPGSLDDIHRTILVRSCAGEPGLCHAGQFEPNLSTPALAYMSLVNRPSRERERGLRVAAGSPQDSLLVDKLRGNDVSTQMPLGAEPLAEDEIAMIEQWIADGALRAPGAEPAPSLDNPPDRPETAVYAGTARLDAAGPASVTVGQTITLRMSVRDFETDDGEIPFAFFLLQTADGTSVVLDPTNLEDPGLGPATFDPSGPMGAGDLLNWRLDWTIGASVDMVDEAGVITPVDPRGLDLTIIAAYIDKLPIAEAFLTFTFDPAAVQVQP
jgi:hypothetical protein